LIPFYPI